MNINTASAKKNGGMCSLIIYRDSIFRIYDMLSVRYKKLKQVHVFGEMFGGGYGMEKSDVKKINKGIQYHPDHVFMCFDMFVTTDDMGMWLFEDDVETICVRNGILTVPAIFRGTFDECLKFDPIFKTKVPKMFGLAPIKDNFAEGVVIKGVKNQKCGRHRIVLKNKNPNFKEKASKLTKIKKPKELTEEHMALLTELMRYVNENRMETLISKIGIPKLSEFNKVRGLYIKDVLEDFYKDNKDADTDMVKELVKKNFGKEVANFMRDDGRWVNLCDGGQDEE